MPTSPWPRPHFLILRGAQRSRWTCASLASSTILALLLLTLPAPAQQPEPPTVRIAVLTLFHPRTLRVSVPHPVTALADGRPTAFLQATLTLAAPTVFLLDGRPIHTFTLPLGPLTLTVPGKLTRTYRAGLTITIAQGALLPVLTIATEQAVASIVLAESPPNAPLEALKAQAIASRSFLLATPGGTLITDTTHDQFLRSPPAPASPAAQAVAATAHLVLTWRPDPASPPRLVPAMYSRSCGGHTRAHPTAPGQYPFYSVACAWCLRHPERWSRPLIASPASTERSRISYNRIHGWSAIPSNDHTLKNGRLQGQGTGHGIGLCQLGAAGLAAHGQSAASILAHFYPNTTVQALP